MVGVSRGQRPGSEGMVVWKDSAVDLWCEDPGMAQDGGPYYNYYTYKNHYIFVGENRLQQKQVIPNNHVYYRSVFFASAKELKINPRYVLLTYYNFFSRTRQKYV